MYFLLKILISAVLVATISEVARRSTLFGALIASLPLTSILALVWLYQDTKDPAKVAALSADILWLVIPSLILFIALPLLIRRGVAVYPALAISAAATVAGYFAMFFILQRTGIRG
jgi:hypothetical protein